MSTDVTLDLRYFHRVRRLWKELPKEVENYVRNSIEVLMKYSYWEKPITLSDNSYNKKKCLQKKQVAYEGIIL